MCSKNSAGERVIDTAHQRKKAQINRAGRCGMKLSRPAAPSLKCSSLTFPRRVLLQHSSPNFVAKGATTLLENAARSHRRPRPSGGGVSTGAAPVLSPLRQSEYVFFFPSPRGMKQSSIPPRPTERPRGLIKASIRDNNHVLSSEHKFS